MLQPTQVLPSNAPPLPDHHGYVPRAVLQEQSSNRQHTEYPYQHVPDAKYPPSLLTENTHIRHQRSYQPAHVYQHTATQRHVLRHAARRNNPWALNENAIEKEASFLYQSFRTSDQYMKYRNRQPKDAKGGQDQQKWPDRLESAFFKALVRWPPMGRRKMLHKEKQRGRNELIADAIEEETGEARTRKQVSSHIQVLKPFVEGNSHIMKYLSKEDMGRDNRHYSGGHHSYYPQGRRVSNYPVVAVPHGTRSAAVAISPTHCHTLTHVKHKLEIFEPTDFQMFVQRKVDEENVDRLHTYTASIPTPRQPEMQSKDWISFNHDFPLLGMMHARKPLDCNVLVAEASLALPRESFRQDKDRVELGISFMCRSRHLPPNAQVLCQNTFYKNGTIMKDFYSVDQVPMTQEKDGDCVETQVKFGSAFWARTLASLAGRLKDDADPSKDPSEEVSQYIRGITASQEVVLRVPNGHERLLVIYWKFRLSTAERGRAYWMPLRLPPSPPSLTGDDDEPKSQRVDSVYDNYGEQPFVKPDLYAASRPATLQSPFEFDNSSSSAGSATWHCNSLDAAAGGIHTAPHSAVDAGFPDNALDVSGGNINISYDPNLLDFSNFDTEAFNFDATGAADFAPDAALQDFTTAADTSQGPNPSQNYSHESQAWSLDNYGPFESQPAQSTQQQQPVPQAPMGTGAVSPSPHYAAADGNQYEYSLPTTTFDSHCQPPPALSWDPYDTPYDPTWQHTQAHEGQAYGGADHVAAGIMEGESLAQLADASSHWAPPSATIHPCHAPPVTRATPLPSANHPNLTTGTPPSPAHLHPPCSSHSNPRAPITHPLDLVDF